MMTMTAGELAAAIGAELNGDKNFEVRGVAAPERAGEHDLIYIEAAKHSERAATSAAGCVIAADDVTVRGKTVLRHAQPKVAFAKAAAVLVERGPIAVGIHATAIVAPSWILLFHGVYGRMYSLFLFTATLSYLAFLAALRACSSSPAKIKANLIPVSGPPGTKVTYLQLAKAIKLIRAGKDVDYEGAFSPVDFAPNGELLWNKLLARGENPSFYTFEDIELH